MNTYLGFSQRDRKERERREREKRKRRGGREKNPTNRYLCLSLAVIIHFKGEAKVEYSGQHRVRKDNGDTENENVQFKASEDYYDFKYNLFGGSEGIYLFDSGRLSNSVMET